ncbi:MAG: HAD family phosphatase [Proteobacteria bacterium]|nr:HAD family phosphatase [Pseudomonadota bacterium]
MAANEVTGIGIKMNKKISAIVFDLGRVLVSWDTSHGIWAKYRKVFGEPNERTKVGLEWEKLYGDYVRGKVKPLEFHKQLCKISGLSIDYPDFVKQWCDVFEPIQGMEELFGIVVKRIPVGLLSDTDPLHWEYVLDHYNWIKEIKKPTLSFDIGVLKPNPESYRQAAGNVGFSPEECFFTDDLEENIEGALKVGMDAVLFTGKQNLEKQLIDRGIL